MPEIKSIPTELVPLIEVQPVLKELPQNTRKKLIAEASFMSFTEGVAMIEEDKKNGFLFLLLKGEAAAIMNGTEAGILEAGDIAGEISISGISPPIASVITRSEVESIAFPSSAIALAILEHPEFGRSLKQDAIRRITGRG